MERTPTISIIVPVYRVEPYLRQCIGSILNQTFRDFELILVDDGSPDRCGAICEEAARTDDRVRVLHKGNGGLQSAWIAGVQAAKGGLIGFVDGDDWIEPEMIETLHRAMEKEEADVAACGLCRNYPDREVKVGREMTEVFRGTRIREELIPQLLTNWSEAVPRIQNSRCDKLFRKKLIADNLRFCDKGITVGEDLNIVLPALLDAEAVVCLGGSHHYHYRQHMSSMVAAYDPALWENNRRLLSLLADIAREKGFSGHELFLHEGFCLYQAICGEARSCRVFTEKVAAVRQILGSLPDRGIFLKLRARFAAGGACSVSRWLTLTLLAAGMWRSWLMSAHAGRRISFSFGLVAGRRS